MLFHFFRYSLDHLNNRQTKLSENSAIHFSWKLTSKQVFGKSFKFFDPPTTKWRSFTFFAELNGNRILMANFSKFRKYQTFGLSELHNWATVKLKFWLFNFSNFPTNFVKNFMKNLPGFKIDFESTDKALLLHQYLWSEISREWNNSPLIFFFFWHLHGRAFSFLNFVKWGKFFSFPDTSKMYCCGLF